jgi:hypothetical protein
MDDIKQYADLGVTFGVCALFIVVAGQCFKYWLDKKSKAPEQEEKPLGERVASVEKDIENIKENIKEINLNLNNHINDLKKDFGSMRTDINSIKVSFEGFKTILENLKNK